MEEFSKQLHPQLEEPPMSTEVVEKADTAENLITKSLLDYLENEGCIEKRGKTLIIHTEQDLHTVLEKTRGMRFAASEGKKQKLSRPKLLTVLQNVKAIDNKELAEMKEGDDYPLERPIVKLPTSRESALRGDFDNQGILDASRILERGLHTQPLTLADGSEFYYGELAITRKLKELGARRDKDGALEIYDEEKGGYRKFSSTFLKEKLGFDSIIKIDGKWVRFSAKPIMFAEKGLPHLMEAGILRESDFRRIAGQPTSEVYATHDRSLNPKAPYLTFGNQHGSVKYLIGRNHIIGTGIKINPETMVARQLDKETVAIIDSSSGTERILCYFPLLTDQEMASSRDATRQRIEERGEEATEQKISSNILIGADAMAQRIKRYEITEFITQRSDESDDEYAKRVTQLNDVRFVTKTFQEMFRKADIGTHNLPWNEQLIIANAVSSEHNKEKLIEFAKKYKLPGLRTFLSLEHGKELGQDILTIGEKLDPQDAERIFGKYSEIIDATKQVGDYLRDNFSQSASYDDKTVDVITEQLLKRGKDVLANFATVVKEALKRGVQLSSKEITAELDKIKTDTLLFVSSFRALRNSGGTIDLESIKNVQFGEEKAEDFSSKDISTMNTMYAQNYRDTPILQGSVLESFATALQHQDDNTFYVFRHNGAITGFYRLEKTKSNTLHFASFNVDPSYQGSGLGKTIMEKSLDVAAQKSIIDAECVETADISSNYIERGFIATGRIDSIKGKEIDTTLLKIYRNDQRQNIFTSKELDKEEVKRRCEEEKIGPEENIIFAKCPVEKVSELFSKLDQAGGDNVYILTRYIREPSLQQPKNKMAYVVFEKVSKKVLDQYLTRDPLSEEGAEMDSDRLIAV